MGLPLVVGSLVIAQSRSENAGVPASSNQTNDQVCAKCHPSIYTSYQQTPMAKSSGAVLENFISADFTHAPSGVHYRIYRDSGRAWLSFDRDGPNSLHGRRELLYFVGSGRRGLTYLFADSDFVFESPINWYGDKHVWDMTPSYEQTHEVPLNLLVHTGCLHCHISAMSPPRAGTENQYAMPLLTHNGVSCERCHGPGQAHLKGGPIVNPAKLGAERRDAVCMQCHMEGRVFIERPGRHIYGYRPGDSLSDYVRYYVLAGAGAQLGAVSQVEALAQSACKRKSGDAMSCTSCHDPHYTPPAQERVAYFRDKCLACHRAGFAAKHHQEQKDCTVCHMPASSSKDIAHTEVTDHRIPRFASLSAQLLQESNQSNQPLQLAPFPDSVEARNDLRDLALAWESVADRGMEAARPRSIELLRRSALEFPNDAATLEALGYEQQKGGKTDEARVLYERALAADPSLIDAPANLGVIEAQKGNYERAIQLLTSVFERSPGRSAVGMNLAQVLCASGKLDDARSTISRVLEFNPDLNAAKKLMENFNQSSQKCFVFQ